MNALKNLPEFPAQLADLIEVSTGQVVSMSLSKNEAVQMILFAFSAGEGISEQEYWSDTLYYVVEGSMILMRNGTVYHMQSGSTVAVPAGVPHAIGSERAFKLLQVNLCASS